jgi:hypothetical protein
MAQTRLKSGNLHMVGGDNGTLGNVLKSKGDGTFEWGAATTPPSFSSVDYPGNDTALDPAGGQNLVINGGGFVAGINVKVGGTNASSVTVNSATQITIVTPAKSAGTYALEFTNTDGGNATANSAVSYNGVPAFTNAAGSLGTFKSGDTVNVSAGATEPDGGAITHTVSAGSLLSGLSLNATTGAITGTAPDVSASTTSSFTITATDNENQSTNRAYSIQVDPILPSDDFNVLTYTGNGGTQTITGLSFQPDFVWLKKRNGDAEQMLNHPNIGIGEYYRPSYASQGRLTASDIITSLNSNGFTLGSASPTNGNNDTFVAYCWKVNGGTTVSNTDGTTTSTVQVNVDKGISMITYSGNGSTATVGHGLGKVPELFFMMDRYNGGGWRMWHKSLNGPNKYLEMGTGSESTSSTIWNNTLPTSTVFSLGNVVPPNGSGRAHVCWAFTSIDGHSKFSSYGGNGSDEGPIVNLGFEPAFLIIRRIDSGDNFYMFDHKRETSNPRNTSLRMNSSAAEGDITGNGVNFLSNGFQIITSDGALNANNGKYIYMAWAADPDTTAPTLADSFNAVTYTGNGSTNEINGLGFSPSFVWLKDRDSTNWHTLFDTVRGPAARIHSNSTNAQDITGTTSLTSFNSDGFTLGSNANENTNGNDYVAWAWKADDNEPTIFFADTYAAAYKFDETNSGETADDLSGNFDLGNDNVTFTTTAKFTRAADFNGTNGRFYNNSFTPLTGSNAYSVSLWFYGDTISGSSGDQWLFGVGNQTNFTDTSIYIRNNNTIFHDNWGNSDYIANASVSLTASTWYHFVFVYDGAGTGTGYLNGTKLSDFSRTLNRTGSTLRIGCRHNETNHFNGKMDQIRFYTQALNQTQVNSLYNESSSNNSTLEFPSGISGAKPLSIVNANANAGFSIVKYEGTGSNTSVPHGLSATPEMIIVKKLGATQDWWVYHKDLNGGTNPAHYFIRLNLTNAETLNASSGGSIWNSTAPTSTVFSTGTTLQESSDYIAYCFHSVSGFSKIGSYVGGGNTNPTINVGFAPDFLMVKKATGTIGGSDGWTIVDSVRHPGTPTYDNGNVLYANATLAEQDDNDQRGFTITSTGFSPNGNYSPTNSSGDTYVYMAFKIN